MPKYTFKVKFIKEIEAVNYKEAKDKFWNEYVYDVQSDPVTFIEDNLEVTKKL